MAEQTNHNAPLNSHRREMKATILNIICLSIDISIHETPTHTHIKQYCTSHTVACYPTDFPTPTTWFKWVYSSNIHRNATQLHHITWFEFIINSIKCFGVKLCCKHFCVWFHSFGNTLFSIQFRSNVCNNLEIFCSRTLWRKKTDDNGKICNKFSWSVRLMNQNELVFWMMTTKVTMFWTNGISTI